MLALVMYFPHAGEEKKDGAGDEKKDGDAKEAPKMSQKEKAAAKMEKIADKFN